MRLEQLQYFLSIAGTHAINKTSLEFYTTHQNISKAIRQLENEMGAPLFTRSSKGMILTREGEMLLPIAERCVNDLHRVQLDIQRLHCQNDLEGILRLFGTPITNATVLPSLLNDFGVLYPNVRYQINETNTLDILHNIFLHKNSLGFIVILQNPQLQDI